MTHNGKPVTYNEGIALIRERDRVYLDCLLMIAEAAIEHISETQSPFEYDDMAFWLDRHGELCRKLYGSII